MNHLPAGLVAREGPQVVRPFLPRDHVAAVQAAAVQPRSTADIRALVQWARRHDEKLVPVSSAEGPRRNGGSVPQGTSVIVDLSQMKRVRHIDGKDAIAVIEPGVTFPEFDAQLANHGLRSFKPLLPRRSKSVVASHLEREPINLGSALPYAVYLQPRVQNSSCHQAFTTFWEGSPGAPGSQQTARTAFHRTASLAMDQHGAYFSRPYGVWRDIAFGRDPHIVPYLRQVKAMFDPAGVLNPGKFC